MQTTKQKMAEGRDERGGGVLHCFIGSDNDVVDSTVELLHDVIAARKKCGYNMVRKKTTKKSGQTQQQHTES